VGGLKGNHVTYALQHHQNFDISNCKV